MTKRILTALGTIATLAALVATVDYFATDKEVEAGLKSQKRMTDLEYYDRRISLSEVRIALHCNLKPDAQLCPYWRKQLEDAKRERERFLRKH